MKGYRFSLFHFFLAVLLNGLCGSLSAQVSWIDATIISSVTDQDIVISGSCTLNDDITISAIEKDVCVTLLDDAEITGDGVTLEISAGVDSAGIKHGVNLALNDKVLHIADAITLKIGNGNKMTMYGGELSVEDNCVLIN